MPGAWYNEHDKIAAAWLRELIAEGLIPDGDVDERSIKDVRGDDLKGYHQVHCFAGIGVWAYALRRGGWPDDRPVGTGSCPCQPFSAAGKQLAFEDPRHLWPDWLRLIDDARHQGQPWTDTLFGEQVATAGAWLDLVAADLETRSYAFAAPDLPAAGFGGAHIRQRLYWVADAHNAERWTDMAAGHFGDWPQAGRIEGYGEPRTGGETGGVADDDDGRCAQQSERNSGAIGTSGASPRRRDSLRCGHVGGLGHHHHPRLEGRILSAERAGERLARQTGLVGDWVACRDGLWRPVEPCTSPLVAEAPGRVGRLRGYGNALDAKVATEFVGAYLEAEVLS